MIIKPSLSSQVIEGRDYAILESARKLNPTEYTLHKHGANEGKFAGWTCLY